MNNIERAFKYFGVNINKSKTIRQISLETKIPYMTLNRIIKKLKKQDLIITKKVGKSIVCSLNKDNDITKQHLIIASESLKNYFLERKPLIKKIHKIIEENKSKEFSAMLFGSYAEEREQKHSDVDLAFIYQSKRTIKNIQYELKTIEKIYDIEINLMIFSEKQFKEMLKAKEENVGKQILKNHIIMYNSVFFWNLVYEVVK